MIPLEKLIPIEAKARGYGYDTTIRDGGKFVMFKKWAFDGNFTIKVVENKVFLWNPSNNESNIQEFNLYLDEQRKLLELATMLQENIIEEEPEDETEEE